MSPASAPTELLSQLMDAAELRHRVLSQNIANVNTPGYKRLDVTFEELLQSQLGRGGAGEVAHITPIVAEEQGLTPRPDGNNVDIDRELGQLNKNSLMYETYSQVLAAYFDSMRRAMQAG
jgi:flagellar basal-body rod protein FlgB